MIVYRSQLHISLNCSKNCQAKKVDMKVVDLAWPIGEFAWPIGEFGFGYICSKEKLRRMSLK